MNTFPIHALSRGYTLGTPKWRPVESGVSGMRMGNGLLRTRAELGQAVWAIDVQCGHLTLADAKILHAFYTANRAAVFYLPTPTWGPLSTSLYETWSCRFDPDSPPAILPLDRSHSLWSASMTLLPILPTVAEEMLVAQWKMNDNAATTDVVDAAGNGHTGTASANTDTLTVAGKIGTALEFATASSRYVSVPDHADLDLTSGGTICLWVKWDGTYTASGGAYPVVIAKYGSWYLSQTSASGALYFYPVSTASPVTAANGALTSGSWKHIVVSFGASGRKIYVNGVDATVSAGDSTLPANTANAVIIGGYQTTRGFFGGVLDDVRIYKRPLSGQEIRAIYNAGSGTEGVIVP